MKKLITVEQENEIVELAKDHNDALVAFGADMYRDGMLKGGLVALVGVGLGMVGCKIGEKLYKHIKQKKLNKAEEEA